VPEKSGCVVVPGNQPNKGGQSSAEAGEGRILNQIYEVDLKGFSYGFRPGRSPHQALDALTVGIQRKRVNWGA
jgi:hypothetical protein